MLEKYRIIKNNNEEILYLFLNVNYEFANEFTNDNLKKKASSYLKSYDIDFKGNKVVFVINGITTKSIDLNDYEFFSNNKKVILSNNDILTIKELLLSLLFTNISITLRKETLKAICVLYRGEIIRNLFNDKLDLEKISLSYHNYNYFKLTYPETFKSNDIAFELVKRGYEVDVLTGIPNYPEGVYYKGYGLFKRRIEKVNGVNFYRCFQFPRGRKASPIGLSLNYISFVISACLWIFGFFAWKKSYFAIITHEPSPITQIIPAIILSKLRGTPVYSWIMDIWPDSMTDAVSPKIAKILTPQLNTMTNFVYRGSH